MSLKLAVCTASVNPDATAKAWTSWREVGGKGVALWVAVLNGAPAATRMPGFDIIVRKKEICGVVPAFLAGIREAVGAGADLVACLHDDLRIDEEDWDYGVISHFQEHPKALLACFSGADGLGAAEIYQTPYDPMQLARQGFFSNLEDAEAHGRRETRARLSACGDGFSALGRGAFMLESFSYLHGLGIKHHFYDSWLGGLAAREKGKCWFLPVRCKHFGGMTAVGSPAYAEWAAKRGGDAAFWQQAHEKGYEDLRDVLPLRVQE